MSERARGRVCARVCAVRSGMCEVRQCARRAVGLQGCPSAGVSVCGGPGLAGPPRLPPLGSGHLAAAGRGSRGAGVVPGLP